MSKTLLVIKSSVMGEKGQSSALIDEAVAYWSAQSPAHQVTVRDVQADAIPHLDGQRVGAFFTPADHQDEAQKAIIAYSDRLIEEIKQADAVMIATPMYNFNIPSQLKAYFDHLARAGVTFQYTETGPVGLLNDKPVLLVATRGGMYQEAGIDHQIPFVQQFLNFLGLTSIETLFAEGLSMQDLVENTLSAARGELAQWLKKNA